MKVLYIVTGLGLGGAEKVVVNLADQVFLEGYQVKIAYLTGEVLVRPKNKKIEIISLGLDKGINFLKASQLYRQLIKSYQPDVVHAHMVHANIFARINRIGCTIPKLICTAHNSNEGGKIRMLAYRLTNFLSDFNTNVSDDASKSLIAKGAFNKSNLITVYNGIDLQKFNKKDSICKLNNNVINFICVGRFNEQKDYPNLFRAIVLLKDKVPNLKFKFSIVGDGELRSELEELIKGLHISNCVELLGKRSDIPDLLNAADFFVLPSKHEGLPTVVIEAMACGTFVIATDCGGSAEIMGDTGILVPPQNSEALAEALKEAVNKTPLEIQENNLKARQRVEELFSLEKSVENWLKIYRNE
ncbi:glycosyltransferase [Acinetobacter variabilis]|uniref:glycosyltransferase n=1 Tax=Acinetobacter variabilis TaxID=70346 RepID=UPI0021D32B23|nr:glycosyltransferase [Acinetobacter variabilis]MCU4311793.1 glycosyltransferase [Acinetobacter variabilis]